MIEELFDDAAPEDFPMRRQGGDRERFRVAMPNKEFVPIMSWGCRTSLETLPGLPICWRPWVAGPQCDSVPRLPEGSTASFESQTLAS